MKTPVINSRESGIFDGVLLASDIDGTLINSRGEVTGPVRRAIDSFCGRGGRFTVATGRSLCGFHILRPFIPLNAPAVLSNGGFIYDFGSNRDLFSEWLSGPFQYAVSDIAEKFPEMGIELHRPDHVHIFNRNLWSDRHINAVKSPFTDITDLSQAPPRCLKILFLQENSMLLELADYALDKHGKYFSFIFSAPNMLEMQNRGVDKAAGISRVASMLGIEPEHVYTAGDAGNDIEMLRAFTSFAPASGTEEARAAASYTVAGHDGDAIAEAVQILESFYINGGKI